MEAALSRSSSGGSSGRVLGCCARYLPREKTSVQWFDFAFVANPRMRHDWREVAHVSGALLNLCHFLLEREFRGWPGGRVAVHCSALSTLPPSVRRSSIRCFECSNIIPRYACAFSDGFEFGISGGCAGLCRLNCATACSQVTGGFGGFYGDGSGMTSIYPAPRGRSTGSLIFASSGWML